MRSTILALAAVALMAAASAYAGGEKGQWELGGYLGRGWPGKYGIYNPEGKLLYGGRLGYFLTSRWNLEFSAQGMPTETEFETATPDVDANLNAYRLNLLYNLGSGGVRPFLTGGLGSEKFSVEDGIETSHMGWNAGGGLRFFLSPRWCLRFDGRYVRVKHEEEVSDQSQENGEASVGLSLLLGGKKKEVEAAEVAPPNQAPTVSCAPDRAEILPGETANIQATASDPEGGPLNYEWSATAGQVTGTGATAVLSFTGVSPPANAMVTVKVTDDHNNMTRSDCAVRLLEPVKPAESVSCIAGGFPRNLSRVGNVDKACLDDVAQRLSADPRARVVVVGHADSRETSADLGQQRADAVKDYLVKERNVEASRITTRSAGSTKPVGAGSDAAAQAGNRRVEVWFVPQGAKEPE